MKVKAYNIHRKENLTLNSTSDLVVVEEPLEIRVGYGPDDKREQLSVAVTMRTPGDDEALAIGFLYTEGIIESKQDVLSIKPCVDKQTGELSENIIRVELSPEIQIDSTRLQRNFYTTSSCGICGKASIEQVEVKCTLRIPKETIALAGEKLHSLLHKITDTQSVFKHTGGIHATALFNMDLKLTALYEDIGRHNSLDKVIGVQLLNNKLPLYKQIVLLSGRAGFEMVQKLAMAGCSIVCSIGAPSSLAIETAKKFNITLVGFLKQDRYNIYTHPHRVI